MIEEIVQKPYSPVVTFPCRWDIKYYQVIDEVIKHMQRYYSKAQNYSAEFRNYLIQNSLSASGIQLYRIKRQKSSASFYMLSKHNDIRGGNYKAGKKAGIIGKLTLKRIIQSGNAVMVTYHLTFEVRNLSVSNRLLADRQLSEKEAEAFSKYAKRKLGITVRHTSKVFY